MFKFDVEIINKINKFALELENENIKVQELYLFGSYTCGEYNSLSDIDIAVVSDDFSGVRFQDYDKFITPILKSDSSIEPIAFTMKDTLDNLFFINEIQKKGIRII